MRNKYSFITLTITFISILFVVMCSWNDPFLLPISNDDNNSGGGGGGGGGGTPRTPVVITDPSDFDYSIVVNDAAHKVHGSQRAIALSLDKSIIYTAYMYATDRHLFAYRADNGAIDASFDYNFNSLRWAKACVVHPTLGKVYYTYTDTDEICIYDAGLTTEVIKNLEVMSGIADTGINDLDPQGIAIYGNYFFASSDTLDRIYRYNLSATGDIVSHDTTWAGGVGYVQIPFAGAELVELMVNPDDGSIWCASEKADATDDNNIVYKVSSDGLTITIPLDIPANATPHDVDFIDDYVLVAFTAGDGNAAYPRGVGVFNISDGSYVTTLLDDASPDKELRNTNGIAVDEENGIIYAVDGVFGSPNDLSVPPSSVASERDLIVKMQYNKW